jgi:lysophospholipid acyltransferase (LPLAT)-like uncharacterized protein
MLQAHFKTEPKSLRSYNGLVDSTHQIAEKTQVLDEEVSSHRFTFRQRVALFFISTIGSLIVRLIGCTLRPSISYEAGSEGEPRAGACIYCFWHRCILPATYIFRNMDIAVMTSRSFDGEYIARTIQHFGFIPVRGSSSRGAISALRGMQRALEAGYKVAFTSDGPRGPRFVAKPGPVLLSRNSGVEIVAFYIAPERAWVLKTWDKLIVPKPFSRIRVVWSSPVKVPPGADLNQVVDEMQKALEQVQRKAEELFPATSV